MVVVVVVFIVLLIVAVVVAIIEDATIPRLQSTGPFPGYVYDNAVRAGVEFLYNRPAHPVELHGLEGVQLHQRSYPELTFTRRATRLPLPRLTRGHDGADGSPVLCSKGLIQAALFVVFHEGEKLFVRG